MFPQGSTTTKTTNTNLPQMYAFVGSTHRTIAPRGRRTQALSTLITHSLLYVPSNSSTSNGHHVQLPLRCRIQWYDPKKCGGHGDPHTHKCQQCSLMMCVCVCVTTVYPAMELPVYTTAMALPVYTTAMVPRDHKLTYGASNCHIFLGMCTHSLQHFQSTSQTATNGNYTK